MKTKIALVVLSIQACGLLFCGSFLFFLPGCGSKKSNETKTEEFQVFKPLVKDTSYVKYYVSDIQSLKNVELRARITGYVEKIHVDEGQFVKQGQVIFSISNQEYKQEVIKAKAVLKSAIADAKVAEVELQNTSILVDKNVVSSAVFEMTQSRFDALNAKIEEAKSQEATALLNLAYSSVRAPFDGIIDRIPYKVGSLINEGTLLTTISDNREIFAYFNVSEREYLDYFNDQDLKNKNGVSLLLMDGNIHDYKGKIETIDGEFDNNTGNISYRARFPNPKQLLKNGSSGNVCIEKKIKNAFFIPQRSTFEVQDKIFVYVIDDSSIVRTKSIVPKIRFPEYYVVESDLLPTDKIIYEGIQKVVEGKKIEAELIPFPVLSN